MYFVAEWSGSGRKYDSSAEGSSVVVKIIEGCCKEILKRTLLLRQKSIVDSAL